MDQLFLRIIELDRQQYEKEYGTESILADPVTSVATRIGIAIINPVFRQPSYLQSGSRLSLALFDSDIFTIIVKSVSTSCGTYSFRGNIEQSKFGLLFYSVYDQKVLATIDLTELGDYYLVKYNPVSEKHYIFRSPKDKILKVVDIAYYKT